MNHIVHSYGILQSDVNRDLLQSAQLKVLEKVFGFRGSQKVRSSLFLLQSSEESFGGNRIRPMKGEIISSRGTLSHSI